MPVGETQRHLLVTKVNVITETKKHTVMSETFSHIDMKVKSPLPQEYINQTTPIIFQIVYSNDLKSYLFNVCGRVSPTSPTTVIFVPESLAQIKQFLSEVITTKKFVVD